MTDLTGWTPHDGGMIPALPEGCSGEVIVLLRGGDEGPKESGPANGATFQWIWDPRSHRLPEHYQPDPMDVLMGRAPLGPDGEVIAWVPIEHAGGRTQYPHVRADLGR